MPYQNGWVTNSLLPDTFVHNIKFIVPSGGGAPTGFIGPGTDSVASTSTGVYTITLGDAPYVKCVGASVGFSQVAIQTTVLQAQLVPPVDGTGNTAVLTFFIAGTPTEPTANTTVYVELLFQRCPVP